MDTPPAPELALQAEIRELRERVADLESQIAAIYESVPAGLCVLDADLRFVRINELLAGTTGLPVAAHLGKSPAEINPITGPFDEKSLRGVLETGEPLVDLEVIGVTPVAPATPRIWTEQLIPLKRAGGAVTGVSASVVEVTGLRMLEEQVSRNLSTFSELVERAPFGIFIVDAQFRIAHMNAASQTGAFRNVRPVIGRDFAEAMRILWPESVAAGIIATFRHTLETGEPFHSPRFIHPRHDVEALESYDWELHPIRLPDGQHGVICYYYDSTQPRQTEAALRESEERYRELFESIDQGFCTIEVLFDENEKPVDYRFLMVNPAFERQTGIANATGRRMREIAPLHEEHWFQLYGRIAVTGESMRFENPATQLHRYYEVFAWKVGEPSERKVAILFNEISHRIQAEAALRKSEEQFRTLANAIPQLCWMAHADGSLFWYNQRWYEYTGTSPEQMEGWGWQSVHDPKVLPEVLKRWKHSIATGEPLDIVFPLRGADGIYRPFLTRVMPLKDEAGNVTRWFGTNTDIDEQRKVEAALRHSEETLRLAQEAAGIGVFEWNIRTGVNTWTPRMEQLYGLQVGTFPGTQPAWENLVHPEDRSRFLADVRQAFDTGAPTEGEWRVIWPDGSVHWLSGRWQVFKDVDGTPVRMTGVNIDVTDSKHAEERLRQAQKLESLGLLAGGVAHDFNNLLIGVIGNASLIEDMLPSDHPVAGLVQGVIKSGEHAAHLTRQMLAYSGQGRFLIERLNLALLIPEMVGLVRPSIAKKIALRLDLQEGLPLIEADRGQIQQVFMNLALNAAEAIGSHDGVVTVRAGVQQVDLAFKRRHPEADHLLPGDYVFLEVHDTGCGMDERTRARIFDPFFSTKFTGRGLGLAAVSGVVRGHKGAILVRSAPKQGSTFTVLFPASVRAAQQPAVAPRRAELRGSGVVLVVDDEAEVRNLARKALERQGYTVLVADSGMAAIEMLKVQPAEIALILLDLSMPGMSGEEALPELRKLRPDAKVIVSSGYSEAETLSLFKGQKVAAFVQKPYTPKRLAEQVKLALT